jgi:hypothetical protein
MFSALRREKNGKAAVAKSVFFVPAALICDKIRKMYEFFCEKINMFAENRQDFYRGKGNSN